MSVTRSVAAIVASAVSASLFLAGGTGAVSSQGCASSSAGGGTGTEDPAGPPILIGASIGLSGSLSGNAVAMQGGTLAAVEQMNALGGVLGRTVQVSTRDDQSDPMQALTVAETLVDQNVSALLGPIGSQEVTMVLPFLVTRKVVVVSSTATSAQLTQEYPARQGFFFRTVPSDALQAVAVALFALQGPSADAGSGACTTMVVVHNDDTYGNPLAAAIESYFKAHGGTIPSNGDIAVPENALSSYLSQVQTIISDVPECLVLAVYPPAAAQLMHDLSDQIQMGSLPLGWHSSFFVIGTDGTYDPSLITDGRASASDPTSQSWVNGTYGPPMYGTVAYGSNHDRQEYTDLLALYSASVGLPPGMSDMEPYTSNQFDATALALLAIEAAGSSTDGPAIQQAMFNVSRGKSCSATPYGPLQLGDALYAVAGGGDINYQGASGDVDFDDYGDVVGDFLVWQVQGSSFVNHTVISSTKLATARSTVDAGGCQE